MICMRLFLFVLCFCIMCGQPAFAKRAIFNGYVCKKNCSAQKAGYSWARKKNLTSDNDCISTSKAFNEGCKVWIKEWEKNNKKENPARQDLRQD